MVLILRQIRALTLKNLLVALVRHWASTPFRAFLLPVIFVAFLAYAQRLFFLVTNDATGMKFEPVGRSEARLMLENRLRVLRRSGQYQEYDRLVKILQNTFQ